MLTPEQMQHPVICYLDQRQRVFCEGAADRRIRYGNTKPNRHPRASLSLEQRSYYWTEAAAQTKKCLNDWSLTSLRLKLIKIGARVLRHACAITFQLAKVAINRPHGQGHPDCDRHSS